jgi:hypothetical protein
MRPGSRLSTAWNWLDGIGPALPGAPLEIDLVPL